MKIIPVFLILVVSCFKAASVYGQANSPAINAAADTIRFYKERFFFHERKINSVKLEPVLKTFNSSALEYKKYYRKSVPAGFILLGGIASGVLALAKSGKETHFWTPYSIGAFGLIAIGIPMSTSASKHLKKSVRLYNCEVLRK